MLIIDNKNISSGVKLDFDQWLTDFNIVNDPIVQAFIDSIKYKNNLKIEFSDEVIIEEEGYLTYKDIIKNLREHWKLNQNVKDLLKTIYSIEDLKDDASSIIEEIANYNEVDYVEVRDDFYYMLSWGKKQFYTLSKRDFFNKIIFYPNAIKKVARGSITEENVYEMVFVEELHHLYHEEMNRISNINQFNDLFKRRDHISQVVRKSLARYYAFKYCDKYSINKRLFEYTLDANPIFYPASGMKYIIDFDHYKKVFDKSIRNLDDAFKHLFKRDEDMAYCVINKDFYVSYTKKAYLDSNLATLEPYDYMIEFEKYLEDNISEASAASYISWVKSSFEKYLNINYSILSIVDYDSRIYLVDLLLSKIIGTTKTENNQKSAVNALKKFMQNYEYIWKGINIK